MNAARCHDDEYHAASTTTTTPAQRAASRAAWRRSAERNAWTTYPTPTAGMIQRPKFSLTKNVANAAAAVATCHAQSDCAGFFNLYCAPTGIGSTAGWCVPRSR